MKQTAISLVVVAFLIIGAFTLRGDSPFPDAAAPGAPAIAGGNVSVVDGKQVIEITVKGGYSPTQTVAAAGLPTVLRFKTNGTFDCSTALRIPALGVSQRLPQTGTTDIDAGTPAAGQLAGTCSMGMYSFDINFQA